MTKDCHQMWSYNNISPARGFCTPPPTCKSNAPSPLTAPASEKQQRMGNRNDLFHVIHKVPAGDSPYVRAKQVQLIEKDTNKAISLFWAAINSGDRVDSALKDMAVSMKQLNRSDEAIEAIKSFRHLCPNEAQESLDNVLVELYKRTGRLDDQIEILQYKLKNIDDGSAFGGRRTKVARSQGRKIQITIEQEKSRLLGNLAWAYMQKGNYETAGELYKQALALEQDKNKECNFAVCLMHTNKLNEAKAILHAVSISSQNGSVDDSYARSFERACQMLSGLEAHSLIVPKEKEGHDEMKKKLRYLASRVSADSCINEGNDCVFDLVASRKQAGRTKVDKPNGGSYFLVQIGNKDNFSRPDDENSKLNCLGLSTAQSPQKLCDDKWKRGAQLEIPTTRFHSSTTRNGDWVSTTEKVGFAQQTNSPVPDKGNSKFPSIEQRGVSCLLSAANQRETSADFPSRKPSFKDPIAKEAQPEAPRNIDGTLEASTGGKLKIALQTSDNNLLSHGGLWGDVGQVRSGGEMEPIPHRVLNGTWNPWGSSEYSQFKSDAIIESRPQAAANGNMQRNNWRNVEQQKFQMKDGNLSPNMLKNDPIMELRSQPIADEEKQSNYWENLERKKFLMKESNLSPCMQLKSQVSVTRAVAPVSFNNGQAIANGDSKSHCWENGERNQFMMAGSNSSPSMQLRSPTPLDVGISPATFTDRECWEQSSDIQAMRDIRLAYNFDNKCINARKNKKSWADMVEEEEEQGRSNFLGSKSDYSYQKSTLSLQTPEKWCNSWSHEEDFNDENLNSNIFHQTPPSREEIDASYKLEALDPKDHYSAPESDVSSRKHLTARRSLLFGQHQVPDPAEHCCSSLLPKKASNFRGDIFVPEKQHFSTSGSTIKPERRNKLQVCQDRTLHIRIPQA